MENQHQFIYLSYISLYFFIYITFSGKLLLIVRIKYAENFFIIPIYKLPLQLYILFLFPQKHENETFSHRYPMHTPDRDLILIFKYPIDISEAFFEN